MLIGIIGIRRARPVLEINGQKEGAMHIERSTNHQVQIDIFGVEVLERLVDPVGDTVMPRVVKLGDQEDVLARHAGVLDSLADLVLVTVGEGGIDVAIALLEGNLDCDPHL